MLTKTVDGRKIASFREDKGMSQTELAALLSEHLGRRVHNTTVCRYENGTYRPSAKTWAAIADVLQVDKDQLLVADAA